MENIPYFHLGIVGACLTYFFKLSEVKLDFFEECYRALREIKIQMTGEISKEIESLATPIPSVFVTNEQSKQVEYYEGVSNPIKGEKFKNWLDTYLNSNLNSILAYKNFLELYRRWTTCWSMLKKLSIYFAIYEFSLAAGSFYLAHSIKDEKFQYKIFSDDTSTRILLVTAAISLIVVVLSLLLLAHTEGLKSKLIQERDSYNGL